MTAYRVTAPYVTVKVRNDLAGGLNTLGFFTGAVLPAATDKDDAARLLRKGMIEEVAAPAADVELEDAPKPAKAVKVAAAKAGN